MPVSKISVFVESRWNCGDGAWMGRRCLHVHRPPEVDRLPEEVEHPPEALLADRHRDRAAGVEDGSAAHDAVGRRHGHRPHLVPADVLLHLGHQRGLLVALALLDGQSGVDLGQRLLGVELHVEDGPDDLDDPAVAGVALRGAVGGARAAQCSSSRKLPTP